MKHAHVPCTGVLLRAGLLVAVASLAGPASAQRAGTTMLKFGVTQLDPQVSSGQLSAPFLPGARLGVDAAPSLSLAATFMMTDNASIELAADLGYKHDVVGAGSLAGAGKLGTVKQIAPTLFGQYRFGEADSAFRPYVGLGLTYAYFFGEEGSGTLTALTNPGGEPTRLSVDAAWGLTPQLGLQYGFDRRWFADVAVAKTFLKATHHLSTGQSVDVKLDPVSINLSVGYRF